MVRKRARNSEPTSTKRSQQDGRQKRPAFGIGDGAEPNRAAPSDGIELSEPKPEPQTPNQDHFGQTRSDTNTQ